MMKRMSVYCTVGLVLGLCLVAASTAVADTTYGVKWKYSAKGEGLKEKGAELDVCTFRSNGTFQSGPIENGTWAKNPKGKFTAQISAADVQRIIDKLFGPGVVNVTQIRQTTYKLKEDDKGAKTGKLKFSMKMRIHCTIPGMGIFDGHMDIKVKFSGKELP